MKQPKEETVMNSILAELSQRDGVEKREVEEGISETWKYFCENEDPEVRKFGLALMENGKPPAPEKIAMHVLMLAQVESAPPISKEPDPKKRLHMAMEKVLELYRAQK